jgi:hypothetical protein
MGKFLRGEQKEKRARSADQWWFGLIHLTDIDGKLTALPAGKCGDGSPHLGSIRRV